MDPGEFRQFELLAPGESCPWEEPDLSARSDFQALARTSGHEFKSIAVSHLARAGAELVQIGIKVEGLWVDARIRTKTGSDFLVIARGTPDDHGSSGLRKIDTVQKMGFVAMQLRRHQPLPVLVLTSDLPKRTSAAGEYLAMLSNDLWDVIALRGDLRGFQRMLSLIQGSAEHPPAGAPWRIAAPLVDQQATLDLGVAQAPPSAESLRPTREVPER